MIKQELGSNFIMAVKSNRKVALNLEDKQNNQYVSIETLQPGQQPMEEWLKQRTNQNHFAMKAKIYQAAIKAAHIEL